MNNITTIIFDLGGVLFNDDWHDGNESKFKEYSDYFGISYDDMEKGWDVAWPKYHLGKITEDEFWNIFLSEAGNKNQDITGAKKFWRKYVVVDEDMFRLIKALYSKYTIGALTTVSREWLDYKVEKYSLDKYFSTIVSSGYSGLAKPDPKIYKMVIENLKVKPREVIFIDDSKDTLPPAQEMGINTILFKGYEKLLNKLNEYGIENLTSGIT